MATIYPLDNTNYTAKALGSYHCTRTRGVYSAEEHFTVTADGSMTLTISPGIAWMKRSKFWGMVYCEEETVKLTVVPPTGLQTATYAVTLEHDKQNNTARAYIKEATSATEKPQPTRDEFFEELIIAYVAVRRGQTSITHQDISDTRLEPELCGLMRDGVTGIPTQQLYEQWLSWFETLRATGDERYQLFAKLLGDYEASAQKTHDDLLNKAALLESEFVEKLAATEAIIIGKANNWFNNLKTDFEQEIYAWYEGLQNTLGEDPAIELYNLIDRHAKLSLYKNEVHGARIQNGGLQVDDGSGGWINVGGSGEAGLSWDYLDSLGLTWDEWDAYGYTWDEFEALRERHYGNQSWAAFNAKGATFAELNAAAQSFADIDLSGAGVTTGPSDFTELVGLCLWSLADVLQMDDLNRDNERIEAAHKSVLESLSALSQALASHKHTAADVGAAAASHTHDYAASNHKHTAADVGAAASDHKHTAADVGAAPTSHTHDYAASNHKHTAADVGALPVGGTAADASKLGGKAAAEYATEQYVNNAVASAGGGDMLKAVYDKNGDGVVDEAATAKAAPWAGITDKPATFPPTTHTHDYAASNHKHTAADVGAATASHTHSDLATAATVTDLTNRIAALEKKLENCPSNPWFFENS